MLGLVELSGITGMSTSTLSTLLHRARKNRESGKSTPNDIPEPDIYFGSSPVWSQETVHEWLKARAEGPNANRVKRAVDPEKSISTGSAVPIAAHSEAADEGEHGVEEAPAQRHPRVSALISRVRSLKNTAPR